jgi:beta-glucosidase
MRFSACLLAAVFSASVLSAQATVPADAPYKNPATPLEQRVSDLLSRMTLEEKVSMLAGSGWMESMPIERLGIPAIKMADGPMGVRSWAGSSAITNAQSNPVQVLSTAFPSGIAMAATWDVGLVHGEGHAIGQEVKALGRDMILGPTVNINRVPLWGRNFEGYGEDPYLAGKMAEVYIKGVQSEGVIPSVKHFAANNEEFERHRIDAYVSERALHEIYFPAFKTAVQEGHAWTVMSAYNLVNGVHCAEDSFLLSDVLKREFSFKGFVISDWGSTYSTAPTVNAGMDLEMPGGAPMKAWIMRPQTQAAGNGDGWLVPEKVLSEIKAGRITEATVNDNVSRVLRVIFESGIFDHPHVATGDPDTPEHRAIALQGATEGIVLLKNEGSLLPLDGSRIHSIAVIGPNAAVARTGGGGSSLVKSKYAVTPVDGIKEVWAKHGTTAMQNRWAQGVKMEGEDPDWETPEHRADFIKSAAETAKDADVAVVVVGRYNKLESEGFDVKTMDLPAGQDELIQAVEKANPRTIVVLNTGNPVTMTKWIDRTPALLDMWYGGQEGGRALAAILFGDANPSGKLPVTFPKKFEDSPAAANYPGKDLKVNYAEGIYVGYRYFDTKNANTSNVAPQFPFGFGLSYTTFAYSNLMIGMQIESDTTKGPITTGPAKLTGNWVVTADIKNTGSRAGAEVVELYIHDGHSKIDRPAHELKGFARVELKPGETKTVDFVVDRAALSYWSPEKKAWAAEPGEFEVQVGSSSRDIRLKGMLTLR